MSKLILQSPVETTSFTTSDGKVFTNFGKAQDHEFRIYLRHRIGEAFCRQDVQVPGDVAEWLVEHFDISPKDV